MCNPVRLEVWRMSSVKNGWDDLRRHCWLKWGCPVRLLLRMPLLLIAKLNKCQDFNQCRETPALHQLSLPTSPLWAVILVWRMLGEIVGSFLCSKMTCFMLSWTNMQRACPGCMMVVIVVLNVLIEFLKMQLRLLVKRLDFCLLLQHILPYY